MRLWSGIGISLAGLREGKGVGFRGTAGGEAVRVWGSSCSKEDRIVSAVAREPPPSGKGKKGSRTNSSSVGSVRSL